MSNVSWKGQGSALPVQEFGVSSYVFFYLNTQPPETQVSPLK